MQWLTAERVPRAVERVAEDDIYSICKAMILHLETTLINALEARDTGTRAYMVATTAFSPQRPATSVREHNMGLVIDQSKFTLSCKLSRFLLVLVWNLIPCTCLYTSSLGPVFRASVTTVNNLAEPVVPVFIIIIIVFVLKSTKTELP